MTEQRFVVQTSCGDMCFVRIKEGWVRDFVHPSDTYYDPDHYAPSRQVSPVIDALIALIEQEQANLAACGRNARNATNLLNDQQATIDAWIQTARSAGVTICNRDLEIEQMEATIEGLEADSRDAIKHARDELRFVFSGDGPDLVFVDVETPDGKSIQVGKWSHDGGLSILTIPDHRALITRIEQEQADALAEHSRAELWCERFAKEERLRVEHQVTIETLREDHEEDSNALAGEIFKHKATIERYREALKEARAAVRIHHHPDCVCVNCAALESESER